jgi:hypothetical protein
MMIPLAWDVAPLALPPLLRFLPRRTKLSAGLGAGALKR